MKILFISNLYPPFDMGGLEQRCQEIAICLRCRGHIVQILTSGSRQLETDQVNGVFRSLFLESALDYYRPLDFFLKRANRERHNLQILHKHTNTFAPDVILIWGMWNLSQNLAFWAEQWMPGRVVYNIASYWPVEKNVHEEYWQLAANRLLTEWIKRPLRTLAIKQLQREHYPPPLKFEHVICASKYVQNTLVRAGVMLQNSAVIYPGIDTTPLIDAPVAPGHIQAKPLRLLYFGNLVHHKGVHTAIEAVGVLKQQGLKNSVELTILGSGHPTYEAQLHTLVEQLDIKDRVRFVGKVPREEIPSWLKRFDVFLFTSIWPEPIAATVMEAMAAGLLVIGTEVGGQAEMLEHGQNALTFKAGDAKSLAEQICSVTDALHVRTQLALAGQQLVLERFTLKRMVDEFEQYLANVVNCSI